MGTTATRHSSNVRGGCITFTNFKHHSKVKALGTYLNWSKVPLCGEQIHILNVYLEPG